MKQTNSFTLIELLVVVAIIGILAGIIVLSLANNVAKAKDAKVQAELSQIKKSIVVYRAQNSSYPTSITECNLKPGEDNTCRAEILTDLKIPTSLEEDIYYQTDETGQDFVVYVESAMEEEAYFKMGSAVASTLLVMNPGLVNLPAISSFTATDVTPTSATLTVNFENGGEGCTVIFKDGETILDTQENIANQASYTVDNLDPNITYEYTVVVSNSAEGDIINEIVEVDTSIAVIASCGISNNANFTSIPTENFCDVGEASLVSGSGPWYWTCSETYNGSTVDCSANLIIDGVCGTANKMYDYSTSTYGIDTMCATGIPSPAIPNFPTQGETVNWNCLGENTGVTASCSASRLEFVGTCETFTDPRDGNIYNAVQIGTQCWMSENLNYASVSGSLCYANNSANCDTYGRLYDWVTAKSVCPSGWHLPINDEFIKLYYTVGLTREAWDNPDGWNASYGGGFFNNRWGGIDIQGVWWASTGSGDIFAIFTDPWEILVNDGLSPAWSISARCLKD